MVLVVNYGSRLMVALALVAALASASSAVPLAVPVSVTVEGVAGRSHWPISTGVPFARGTLKDSTSLAIRDPQSPEALQPVQARVLARWPDGSVRWALVDWQTDASAGATRRVEIVAAAKPPDAPRSLVVTQEKTHVSVDTGRLQFRVPIDHFAVLENVVVDKTPVLSGAIDAVIAGADEQWTPQPPASVKVLENGPLRVRLESRGSYNKNFEYIIRIDAYAGQPWVRMLHTFEQHASQPYLAVRQIALRLPLPAAKALVYRAGIEGAASQAGKLEGGVWRLRQLDNNTLSIQGDERPGQASGWLDVSGDATGVAVAAPYFWQEYPQGLTIEPGRLTYELLSADARPLPIGMGAAKTHEVTLAFHGSVPPSDTWLAHLAQPPIATVDPKWIHSTAALRNSIVREPATNAFVGAYNDAFHRVELRNAKERWDDSGAVHCVGKENPRLGAFGMFHWGDWNYPGYHDDTKGCDAWGNLEYDLTQVYALGYATSGDPRLRAAMLVAARHFMDVDIVHHQEVRRDWIGMNHPKNPLHFSFELGGVDLGHSWTEGLLSAYFFSGDERSLAAARGIGDYLVRRSQSGVVTGNPRQFGWPQIALVALYEATGESQYRTAALWYGERGMSAHAADKIRDWKLGILAEGLVYSHSVSADANIRKWLKRYSTAALEQGARDPRFFPALAYVGQLEDDDAARQAALRAANQLRFGSWAKPFTIAARIGFAIYSRQEIEPLGH